MTQRRVSESESPRVEQMVLQAEVGRLSAERLLLASEAQQGMLDLRVREFPEVETTVSRVGRPEIATDPMGPDMADTYAILKPRSAWRPGVTRETLVSEMAERLEKLPGIASSMSQPIKFRMMELIEGVGVRSDVAVKIFGDDMDVLLREANEVAAVVRKVPGAADVKVQQITGLPVLQVRIDRPAIARYGINVADVQEVIQSAIAGTQATTVLEGFMRFALVVRFPTEVRSDSAAIGNLLVSAPSGEKVPLAQLAKMTNEEGPAEIARENGQRRISVEINVRGRDIGSFVAEARQRVDATVHPPSWLPDELGRNVRAPRKWTATSDGRCACDIPARVPVTVHDLQFAKAGRTRLYRYPIRDFRRHPRIGHARHVVLHERRRRFHRAVWRGGVERSGDGNVHQPATGRGAIAGRCCARRCSHQAAPGVDDRASGWPGLRPDGPLAWHRRRSSASARDGGHWRVDHVNGPDPVVASNAVPVVRTGETGGGAVMRAVKAIIGCRSRTSYGASLCIHLTVIAIVSRSSTLLPAAGVPTNEIVIVYAPGVSVTIPVTLTFEGLSPGLTVESTLLSCGSAAVPSMNATRIVPLYFVAPDFTGWRWR